MKRFIKRNVVLVAVLAVAVIGTVFMMIYAVSGYIEMNNAIKHTEDLRQQIVSLSQQKPAPSQENIDIIRHDAKLYKNEVADIQRYFGRPYSAALDKFYDTLGLYQQAEAAWQKEHSEDEESPELTPEVKADLHAKARDAFYEYFKEFWNQRREDALNNASIFREFRSSRVKKPAAGEDGEAEEEDDSGFPYRWTPETWDAAVVAFADTAAPKSREPINADNREDILFMALGLPRDFGGSPNKAALYLKDIQRRLATVFAENKIFLDEAASYFSFVDVVPAKEQIAYVAKVGSIIDDLGVRIAGPKPVKPEDEKAAAADAEKKTAPAEPRLTEVWEFERVDLSEQESDAFEIFRFRVKVLGTLESIQALVKRLNDAAEQDNRFYLVRRMTIRQLNDDAHDIMLDAGLINEGDLTSRDSGASALMGGLGAPGTRPGSATRPGSSTRPGGTTGRTGAGLMPGMPGMTGMPGVTDMTGSGEEKQARPKNLRHSQLVKQGDTTGSGRRGAGMGLSAMPGMGAGGGMNAIGGYNPGGGMNPIGGMNAIGGYNPGGGMNPAMVTGGMPNMNLRNGGYNLGGGYGPQTTMSEEEKRYWQEQEDRQKPMQERSTYAQPVIGADIDMEVDLVIDCIVLSNKDFEQE